MTINPKRGVLLTNIGTPDQPAPHAVRRYLKEFLLDRRVIEIPRLLWLPLLYGWILPFRAKKSARLLSKSLDGTRITEMLAGLIQKTWGWR